MEDNLDFIADAFGNKGNTSRDNHLEDTIRYSRLFHAARVSLLTVGLGIDEKYKPVIQKYIKFFSARERTQRFYDLEIEKFTRPVQIMLVCQ